jgi:hypothetical protein
MFDIVHSGVDYLAPSVWVMRSPDKSAIKAEIQWLEAALGICTDTGVKSTIELWIAEAKQKLAEEDQRTN